MPGAQGQGEQQGLSQYDLLDDIECSQISHIKAPPVVRKKDAKVVKHDFNKTGILQLDSSQNTTSQKSIVENLGSDVPNIKITTKTSQSKTPVRKVVVKDVSSVKKSAQKSAQKAPAPTGQMTLTSLFSKQPIKNKADFKEFEKWSQSHEVVVSQQEQPK